MIFIHAKTLIMLSYFQNRPAGDQRGPAGDLVPGSPMLVTPALDCDKSKLHWKADLSFVVNYRNGRE